MMQVMRRLFPGSLMIKRICAFCPRYMLNTNVESSLKLSCWQRKHSTLWKNSDEEFSKFMATFPELVRDLTKSDEYLNDGLRDVCGRFEEVLNYNVPGGKKNRGTTVPLSYQLLLRGKATEENLHLARIAGWCVEILEARLLVCDDILDGSSTRRGQPSWYKVKGVGMQAINDSNYLDCSVYHLLHKYFRNKRYYMELLHLFHDAMLQTTLGQYLDTHCVTEDKRYKLESFNMDLYTALVKYKTAYYTFQLPVAIAMHMAGVADPLLHKQAENVLMKIGHFFQAQDDFLDCFGDPEKGEIGTDIEFGKCVWLVVAALQKSSAEQRRILEENYGYHDPEKVARVKQLYEELALPEAFRAYEEESYRAILKDIEQIPSELPHDIFHGLVRKTFRRQIEPCKPIG